MRPEANLQRRGDRSSPGFSHSLISSGSLVAPPHPRKEEKTNHIRHHQPQKLTVRENGAGPFRRLGGTAEGVPLERNDRAHWSNDELGVELMTPSIVFAQEAPVSAITLGALVDIGWTVDMSAAEAYEVGHRQLYREGEGLVVFDGLDRPPGDAVPENAAACNFTKYLCGLHEVFGLPVGLGPARTGRRCRIPRPSRLTTRSSWRPRKSGGILPSKTSSTV